MKAIRFVIIKLTLLCCLLLLGSCAYFYMTNPKKSVATVVAKYNSQTTSYYKTEYFIKKSRNGTIEQGGPEELFEGAVNVITYDSIHPGNHKFQLCQPVFMANEDTRKTIAVVTNTQSDKETSEIYFEFSIANDKKYKKCQCVKGLVSSIKQGDKYEVEYIVDNPERAILLLDSLKTEKINGAIARYPFMDVPKQHLSKTIGTCIHCGTKYSADYFTFFYKKNAYSSFDKVSYEGCTKGDKFIITIDSLHPQFRNKVLLMSPAFTSIEKTKSCTGTVTNISPDNSLIQFEYEIETDELKHKKKRYLREQTITPNNQLKKGQTYTVEYSVDEPRRAIILISSFKTDTINGIIVRYPE